MSLEQQVAALVTSTSGLTAEVVGKMAQIDAKVATAASDLDGKVASRAFTFKNRIINGDMRIDQRNSGAALVNVSRYLAYPVDRFRLAGNDLPVGRFTLQQSTDAPAGFSASLKALVTTAEAVGAGQVEALEHPVEGLNLADLAFGTEDAQDFCISFLVKASIIGKYTLAIRSAGGTQEVTYAATYTVEKANTWEKKALSIPGPKIGKWNKGPVLGMLLDWNIGSGAGAITDQANVWQAGNFIRTTGDVNLIETLGASLQLTGIQLEKGSTATPFDVRPLSVELMLCQRYYFQTDTFDQATSALGDAHANAIASNTSWLMTLGSIPPVQMRATPTVTIKAVGGRVAGAVTDWSTGNPITITTATAGRQSGPRLLTSVGLTIGRVYGFDYSLTAEL